MPGSESETHAIVFDLDDTLYAERDYVLSGYAAVSEQLSDDPNRRGELRQWLWERFLSGRHHGAFDALNERFSLGLTRRRIIELVGAYRNHKPSITPRPGIVDLLTRLGGEAKLGIISDGFLPAQELKLQAIGISDYFDAVVFTEALGRESWKPSPDGFEALCRTIGVEASKCTYIGDNPSKDFAAPNALGWRTVQLLLEGQIHSHKHAPHGGEAQTVINSIGQLAGILTL